MANGGFTVNPAQHGAAFRDFGDFVAQERQKSAEAEYTERAKQAVTAALQSGDPRMMQQVSIQFPEVAQTMREAYGFTNKITEQVAKEGYLQFLTADPADTQRRAAILKGTAETIQQAGGRPVITSQDVESYMQDPEGTAKSIELAFAGIAPDEYEALTGGKEKIGTYNPRDYTTQSFAEFQRTGDPSVLQRYESSRIIDVGGVPHMFNPADRTITPGRITQSGFQATGQPQPYQDGSTPARQPEGREITATDVAASQAEITGAEERAKQDVRATSPEAQQSRREAISKSRANIASTADVVSQVDSIIDNENYLDSLTGVRGVLPAAPGTPGYDATVALDRLKNSLTLGNLDKMSGVLSESDIKILASEAGGLEAGMSRESMIDRLTEIRSVFQSKTEEERKKLREMMKQSEGQQQSGGQMSEQDADAFINSVLGQ